MQQSVVGNKLDFAANYKNLFKAKPCTNAARENV
jgi:hypothetical protein